MSARRPVLRRLLLGAAVVTLAGSGLAAAGVDLPDEAADTAREQVADVETGPAAEAQPDVEGGTDAGDDVGAQSQPEDVAAWVAEVRAWAEAWSSCVREAAQPDDTPADRAGGFNPTEGCPPRPENPHAAGAATAGAATAEEASGGHAADGHARAEEARGAGGEGSSGRGGPPAGD